MSTLTKNNRCKLLVFNIDSSRIKSDDLRKYFTEYGPIEWIHMYPRYSSAIIYFSSYLTVDRLVSCRTCLINENLVRLRRFRLDRMNCHIDCNILRVKSTNMELNELLLSNCFGKYQSDINKITVYSNNQALIFFSDYDFIDQILLLPSNSFQINNETLILERIIPRKRPQVQTKDFIIDQLLNKIECLSRQLREQPGNSQAEIQRLESELFVLKNENVQLKLTQSNNKIVPLEDLSNQLLIKTYQQKRSRSDSHDTPIKRRRENVKF